MPKLRIHRRAFNEAFWPYLNCNVRKQIFFGGSSSGKSFFILGQRTVYDLWRGGRNFLVVRNVGKYNSISTFNEITKAIRQIGIQSFFHINESSLYIGHKENGSEVLFAGLDDVQKIKSVTPTKGSLTDIIVEEATETEQSDLKEVSKRLRGLTGGIPKRETYLLNPIYRTHWIYKEYFEGRFSDKDTRYQDEHLLIHKSTYKDNLRFLEKDDVYDLEHEKNQYYKEVYTNGNWGILGKVIFTNWTVEDISAERRKSFSKIRNGLDFGFSGDPAVLIQLAIEQDTIYIFGEEWRYELTNQTLAVLIKEKIGDEPVWCDCAEPKSIKELQQCGIAAYPVTKGKDSVVFGIQWLQGKKIVVDKRCQNVQNELALYQWEKDKQGNYLPQPVDKFNHTIDAIRYACERDMIRSNNKIEIIGPTESN